MTKGRRRFCFSELQKFVQLFSQSRLQVRRVVRVRDEAFAAPGFVFVAGPYFDSCLGFNGALRVIRGVSAFDADGVGFRDKFRYRQELGHRFERAARLGPKPFVTTEAPL